MSVHERVPLGVKIVSLVGLLGATWGLFVGAWWVWGLLGTGATVSLALGVATCLLSLVLLVGYAGVYRLRYWGYVLTTMTIVLWLLAFAIVPLVTGVLFAVLAEVRNPATVFALLLYGASLAAVVGQVVALLYLPRHREAFYEGPPDAGRDAADVGRYTRRRPR